MPIHSNTKTAWQRSDVIEAKRMRQRSDLMIVKAAEESDVVKVKIAQRSDVFMFSYCQTQRTLQGVYVLFLNVILKELY